MRSFTGAADQYARQFDHNRAVDRHATQLTPACQIRLQQVLSDPEASLSQGAPSAQLGVRDGFFHMARLTEALKALDRCGWKRSFHQLEFHLQYSRACARVFYKLEPPGSFERAHKRILEINGWDCLAQEILISTPRRFGKTVSVSM
jgi:hypothetical protein